MRMYIYDNTHVAILLEEKILDPTMFDIQEIYKINVSISIGRGFYFKMNNDYYRCFSLDKNISISPLKTTSDPNEIRFLVDKEKIYFTKGGKSNRLIIIVLI